MPEKELDSCSPCHVTGLRKPQSQSQTALRDQALKALFPSVPPSPCVSPAGQCWHFGDSGGLQRGWGISLGWRSCFCGWLSNGSSSFPPTALTVLGHCFLSHRHTDIRIHTHRHTQAHTQTQSHTESSLQLVISDNHPPVVRTDGAAWCLLKDMTSLWPTRWTRDSRTPDSQTLHS